MEFCNGQHSCTFSRLCAENVQFPSQSLAPERAGAELGFLVLRLRPTELHTALSGPPPAVVVDLPST